MLHPLSQDPDTETSRLKVPGTLGLKGKMGGAEFIDTVRHSRSHGGGSNVELIAHGEVITAFRMTRDEAARLGRDLLGTGNEP